MNKGYKILKEELEILKRNSISTDISSDAIDAGDYIINLRFYDSNNAEMILDYMVDTDGIQLVSIDFKQDSKRIEMPVLSEKKHHYRVSTERFQDINFGQFKIIKTKKSIKIKSIKEPL